MRLGFYARYLGVSVLKYVRNFFEKKEISTRERTKLCYFLINKWCSEVCNIDCWADCTADDKKSYDDKYTQILDLVQCDNNSKVLEIGPGTGRLLSLAKKRTKDVMGIDITPENIATCAEKGLKVLQGDAISKISELSDDSFDIVIANSSMEHAVTEYDAISGKGDAIYLELFREIQRILKPGGRFYLSLISFDIETDPQDAVKDPYLFPIFSDKFHLALLTQTFSGWYPFVGQLDPISEKAKLKKVYEYNGTQEYLASCENWPVLWSIFNPFVCYRLFTNKEIRQVISRYPYYCFLHLVKLLSYSWEWQFTPNSKTGKTPTKYLCQVYEKVK